MLEVGCRVLRRPRQGYGTVRGRVEDLQHQAAQIPLQGTGDRPAPTVVLLCENATSPREPGLGDDTRQLGIWIHSLRLRLESEPHQILAVA